MISDNYLLKLFSFYDYTNSPILIVNKGNKKITEFRTILQRESQNS
jgi:hypothetical protein